MDQYRYSHLERTLVGTHVVLRPLVMEDAEALWRAVGDDRSTFGFTPVPDSLEASKRYIEAALSDAAQGTVVPFSVRLRTNNEIFGTTRFLNLRWYFDRVFPDLVEIGGTWYNPAVQRTAVNTEAKLLLFRLAFTEYGVGKVDLKTDARNERSRTAMTRLGATFEGILLAAHPSSVEGEEGQLRDSAMFGVVAAQWPEVEHRLLGALRR